MAINITSLENQKKLSLENVSLSERVLQDIRRVAEKNGVEKVILFGSRARGTNWQRSDIDLAIRGGNGRDFRYDVDEEVWTLLKFDVVLLDREISEELQQEIARDGIVIYEKI